jgi:uncharacterized membrane-anchored protein
MVYVVHCNRWQMEMEWKEEQKQKARAKAVAALEGASALRRARCAALRTPAGKAHLPASHARRATRALRRAASIHCGAARRS